eukprot:scaffold248894_cov66-Cyclotella_meneghiniana.AAC.1
MIECPNFKMVVDINKFKEYDDVMKVLENGGEPDELKLKTNKAYASAWMKLSRCDMPYLHRH